MWSFLTIYSLPAKCLIVTSALLAIGYLYLIHQSHHTPDKETGFENVGGPLWYISSSLVNQGNLIVLAKRICQT